MKMTNYSNEKIKKNGFKNTLKPRENLWNTN